ncbi:MAG: site-specific integrase [Ruminococcus sp.]|nr:site-specific integrase [Ruminococcus sp.]
MKITGVYQLDNGFWAYRYTLTTNGQKKDVKKTKSDSGKPFKTETQAARARDVALKAAQKALLEGAPKEKRTMQQVYDEYCEHGMKGKAYSTKKKQDSLWRNHLKPRFGARLVDSISVGEINDYLAELYYTEGRAYRYVEGFLKMFYLIFGQAYSHNYIDTEVYNKLCVNKDVRITMPKIKVDDDTEIVAYNPKEIDILDNYFSGTNAETAYLLGRFCGLRINETYGLKWDNVDFERGTLTIDRQMQYQEGLIKLVSLKTRNARRTIYLNEKMKAYLSAEFQKKIEAEKKNAALRRQNAKIIQDLDGKMISSTELVNCLPDGKIQTVNSMKYHSRTIKTLGIDFKYHHLRHTYGTMLANMNTPTHILCNQMGHASGKVTERYYLAVSKQGIDVLLKNLNAME